MYLKNKKRTMFINDESLKEFLLTLSKHYTLVAPIVETPGKPPILSQLNHANFNRLELKIRPLTPYKFFFQPPSEELFTYKLAEGVVELGYEVKKPENLLLLGLRSCDLKALEKLDMVMLEEPADPFYKSKRENILLVSLDCSEPSPSCFCTEVGLKPYPEEGYDLNLSRIEGGYLAEAGSGKGEELLKQFEDLFAGESEGQLEQRSERREAVYRKVKEAYTKPLKDLSKVGEEYFMEFTKRCVECSGCVFTCPTCHCFYISDYRQRELGGRLKTIDSCLFEGFQRVAAGVNPRATLNSRLRQRFLKKFVYFKQRYGEYGCVGCGRCVEVCPGEIDIREAAGLI